MASTQPSTFRYGLIFGMNFSELEGEGITDYFGINAGMLGTARITPNMSLGLEMLYSQNGEYVFPEYYPLADYGRISLNHLEVPFNIYYHLNPGEEANTQWLELNLGLAYAYLFRYRAWDRGGQELTDQIIYQRRNNYLMQFGLGVPLWKAVKLHLKATLPVNTNDLDWTLAVRLCYWLET